MNNEENNVGLPIENWKFVFTEDERAWRSLIEGAKSLKLDLSQEMLEAKIRALDNAEKYLGQHDFQLLADGSLVVGRLSNRPVHVLEIEITEATIIGFLGRLETEFDLREKRNGYQRWSIHGHLASNPSYVESVALDDEGTFYLEGRRGLHNLTRVPLSAVRPAPQIVAWSK